MNRAVPCQYCGALIPSGAGTCIICGAEHGHEPAISLSKSDSEKNWDTKKVGTSKAMRRPARRLVAFAMAIVILLAISGGGVAFYGYISYLGIVSAYTSSGAVMFHSDGMLQIYFPALGEPRVIADVSHAMQRGHAPLKADNSADLRFVAYLNKQNLNQNLEWEGNLYLLDLPVLSMGDDERVGGVHLAGNVVYFRFLNSGDRLLLLTSAGDLYLYDYSALKEPFRVLGPEALRNIARVQTRLLDSDVRGIGMVDGRYLLYYKGQSANIQTWEQNLNSETGDPFDLYLINLENESAAPAMVGQDIYRVKDNTGEFERIVFTRRTRMPPLAEYSVYVFHRGSGQSERIADGVRHVVDASAAQSAVLALMPSEETLSFRDLINDDLHESDFAMRMPHWEDYIPEGIDIEDLDYDERDQLFIAFDKDFILYEQMRARETMRPSLREHLREFMLRNDLSFNLELIGPDGSLRISDRIYNRGDDLPALAWGNIESGDILYVRGEREALRQIVMSELTHEQVLELTESKLGVMRHLTEHMPEIFWHTRIGGDSRELFMESGARQIARFLMAGDGIYFSVLQSYRAELGTLYYTFAAGNGAVLYLDEDVAGYIGLSGPQGEWFVYRMVTFGVPYSHDILLSTRGSPVLIATGVCPYSPVKLLGDNAQIIAFFRTDESGGNPGLYIYANGHERFIARDISYLHLYSNNLIYLTRQQGRNMVLYIYQAGQITLLGDRVADAVFFS